MSNGKLININVGVLGHVDSGKTSLCKVLSTISSTACFDKNPQSKERGITLDLGFSSFQVNNKDINDNIKTKLKLKDEDLLFTLVDCPGHASLIRTIICGARIIDIMILVIDVVKGIQTQTAECMVIGEILCDKVLIVFNKIDLLTEKNKKSSLSKLEKRILAVLAKSKIKSFKIVECSTNPGGSSEITNSTNQKPCSIGLENLIGQLLEMIENPLEKRIEGSKSQALIYAVDHCFSIRGQGTILTGTVLSGSMEVGNTIYIPAIDLEKKIKSIQMFRKPVNKAIQGDRVGVCITQMDPSLLERGLVCLSLSGEKPLVVINTCLINLNSIGYFKYPIKSKQSKFHITIGMDTVMGSLILFDSRPETCNVNQFDWNQEYEYVDEFNAQQNETSSTNNIFALIRLEKSVVCALNSLVIGSKLDTDIHANVCRLAFYGPVLWMSNCIGLTGKYPDECKKLKVFKKKHKSGVVERIVDSRTLIVRNLFKKETNIKIFERMKIRLEQCMGDEESEETKVHSGDTNTVSKQNIIAFGYIEGNFGQSGKCRVIINDDIPEELMNQFNSSSSGGGNKKKKGAVASTTEKCVDKLSLVVVLEFKKYIFDSTKSNIQ